MRKRIIAVIFQTAALTAGLWGLPSVSQVPVPAISSPLGSMPGIGDLPARPAMPEVMVMNDGRKVTSVEHWKQRREEMKRLLQYYATGAMPPAPGNVKGRALKSKTVLDGRVIYQLVHLSFGPSGKLGFDIAIFRPAAGKGPFPTVIFPAGAAPGATPLPTMVRPPEQGQGLDALAIPLGDQTSRAAAAASARSSPAGPGPFGPPSIDPESAAEMHHALFERGYALVTYNYQDTGEDTIGRNTDGSWQFRNTRFFPAYRNYDWGLLGGWAWSISRVVDFIVKLPFVDRTKLIATGHSRLGKAVLVAGAFDDRIALVAPAGSGAGGTGAWRFNGGDTGKEGLDIMLRKYTNWFSPNLYQFRGQVEKLPFDQHWFVALAAPRAFLSLEGTEDQNCVPEAVKQAYAAAAPAFSLLKASSRLGVSYASHRHAFTADDWDALLDFADQQFLGRPVSRRFSRFPNNNSALP